jgi:site-specific recombinase XerD
VRLIQATSSLVVEGRSFEGFPLLVHEGHAVEPAQTFLWDHLTRSGRRGDPKTWEKYGRALYDYMAFCLANGADWRASPPPGMPSALHWYRDWSRGEVGNEAATVNGRLRLICKFYEWCVAHRHIDSLPFDYEEIRSGRSAGMLAHLNGGVESVERPDLLLIENRRLPKLLHKAQVTRCLSTLANETHRLMFELMVRTGLRHEECTTFPSSYVFDPAKRATAKGRRLLRIHLRPRDMDLKFSKARAVDIPADLMEELWWYSVRHRPKRARHASSKPTELFLTEHGGRYKPSSVTSLFKALAAKVGFHVRPHMLRHTYATYTLMALRQSEYRGDPLLYLRDRLGHRSVATTSIYLQLIDALATELLQSHESELAGLFAELEE